MSHELRTPLNAIVGYVDLLDAGVHGTLTAAQRDTIHRVRRSSHVLLGLINDVLNIARIEAGQVIYRLDTFTLETLIRDLEMLMSAQYANAGIDLRFIVDGDIAVTADYDKTQQIFLNLLSNSLKFTEPGGTVSVHAFAGEEFATITVTDTGRGIPKGQLEEIFEPFVQVDRTSTPESQQGVGLGLAISRDLARGMSGDIIVESEVGKGAMFTVTLPFAGETAKKPDA
jgi:signal transduction histidine kinase